jgi:hypothetical protein
MSRGHGKLERMILSAVEARPASYLIDLLPVAHTRAQAVALERAARNLAREGKIDLAYDQGKLVILKPSKCSQGWAPSWEEREEEADDYGDHEDYGAPYGEIRAWRKGGAENQEDKADRAEADRRLIEEEEARREELEELWDEYGDD